MKKIVLSAVIFLLTSCAMSGIKQKQEYAFSPYFNIYSPIKTKKTVLIKSNTTDEKFNTNLIYYRAGKNKMGYYAFSRWSGTLSDMFENCLINSLNKSKLFKLSYANSNYPVPDYVLEFSIIGLEPIFDANTGYVSADIRFSLFSYKTHKLISKYEFCKKTPINKIDIKNIVNLIDHLVHGSISGAVKYLTETLNHRI